MEKSILEIIRKKYEESDFSSILYNVSGVYIPLDNSWKNIGIGMSGGVDSTLLVYILCTLIEKHNLDISVHVLSHVRMWKLRPWQKSINLNVFNYIKNRFPNINFKRYENFLPPDLEWKNSGPTLIQNEYNKEEFGDVLAMRSFAEYICYNENINAYYNGLTRNPSDPSITMALDCRNLSLDDIENNFHYSISNYHMGGVSLHPFRFIEKDWIVGRYKEFEIMDLFDLTRSCEGDRSQYPEIFKNLDYRTYTEDMIIPECGKCFWCQERNWGLKNSF